jgi:iron(II)-dependent oxidoreductase
MRGSSMMRPVDVSKARLAEDLLDARRRTLDLLDGLDDGQLMGPRLAIVNPLRWEAGHVAWFQEHWVLRHLAGEPALREDGDRLWDSAKVAHDTRWDLPLPSPEETRGYMREVLARVLDRLERTEASAASAYFHRLATFHEDMHGEAFNYTRQTLAYPAPAFLRSAPDPAGALPGDVDVPGGRFTLGAERGREPFVFDNEKWAHEVEVASFRIARAPVTNAELAELVESGGYSRRELWSEDGWAWRTAVAADAPLYWRESDGGGFEVRRFDRFVPLASLENQPAIHVNAFEAEAWCRFRGRRLPTEPEWEMAACGPSDGSGKRRFPWGDEPASPGRANLDAARGGCIDVAALPASDSVHGCRQMIGNVWEWTATRFAPYPGFEVDPYKEYSEPWFASPHRVLRGGCWATRARLLRNTWRNFYEPHRRDVLAGFRTCAA